MEAGCTAQTASVPAMGFMAIGFILTRRRFFS